MSKKILYFLVSALSVLLISCNKDDPAMDFNIGVRRGPIDVTAGMEISSTFVKGKGPLATDHVYLRSLSGGSDFDYPINNIKEDSFTFVVGSDLVSGRYDFCIKRGNQIKSIAEVQYNVVLENDVKPAVGSNIYGLVHCSGKGIAGVAVSDGYQISVTDANGVYQLKSDKKNPYVFISIPSGYEVVSEGIVPQFFKPVVADVTSVDRRDFELFSSGDQTDHTMLIFGDIHLAGGKQSDRTQFSTFTKEINSYLTAHPNDKVYAMTLGDMTWDVYWYTKKYCFEQYLADANTIRGLQVFHTIGNHDHDMNATGDWDSVVKYKNVLGPNYYSFNIGKVHYVVLDNIECTNKVASQSDGSYRTYNETVVNDVLGWLKKDLALQDKSTPVVVTYHAPIYNAGGGDAISNVPELNSCFAGFTNVTYVSGHTHKIYTVLGADKKIKEYNSGAVCAAWWWTGYFTPGLNLTQDGAPSGYRIMEVKGNALSSYFKGIGRDDAYQFRSYDRNNIEISAEKYLDKQDNAELFISDVKKSGNYNVADKGNKVLINVWDYNENWKVEVSESGKPLEVKRVSTYDPLYLIAYEAKRYGKGDSNFQFKASKNNHIFQVTASSATSTLDIKVTDDEGRVYTETMTRPKAFSIDKYLNE